MDVRAARRVRSADVRPTRQSPVTVPSACRRDRRVRGPICNRSTEARSALCTPKGRYAEVPPDAFLLLVIMMVG